MSIHRWLAAAALTLAQTSVAFAADPAQPAGSDPTESNALVSAGADLAVASDYMWRGFLENQTLSAQPNLWLTVGDFTVSSWRLDQLHLRRCVRGPLLERSLRLAGSRQLSLTDVTRCFALHPF